MSPVKEGLTIPCAVDVDADDASKARYALRQLLVPLNLEPEWVDVYQAKDGIYYGNRAAPQGAVHLAAAESAPRFFRSHEPYDAQAATWFEGAEGHIPVLFSSAEGEPDIVASAFVWLSGWQEYVSLERDRHGRAPFGSSLPALFDVPHRPVVDAYRILLERRLRAAGIDARARKWNDRDWAFCPTHDIDYLRKWRPGILYREFVQDFLFNRRSLPLGERLRRARAAIAQVLGDDPYRAAFRRLHAEVRLRGGAATFFLKAGGADPHDVPYALENRFLRARIADLLRDGFEIGLHPSYATPDAPDLLAEEIDRLRAVVGRDVNSIRHHYLRFDPAVTPRHLDALGIAIDSTVGFADHEGFRRGTCLPFQLYDLEADAPLSTWEMPLAVMDSALFNRRGLDATGAIEVTRSLAVSCRRYGGVLVVLWHNMVGDELEAPGWDRHFLKTLDYGVEHGAEITTLAGALDTWT